MVLFSADHHIEAGAALPALDRPTLAHINPIAPQLGDNHVKIDLATDVAQA